jgi:hypothetical protein
MFVDTCFHTLARFYNITHLVIDCQQAVKGSLFFRSHDATLSGLRVVVGFRAYAARGLFGARHIMRSRLTWKIPIGLRNLEISIFGVLEVRVITQYHPSQRDARPPAMVEDHEVIVISDSEDEEESIAVTETDTESIEHTAEWLDSPSHTIGSLEPTPYDDESFDVLDQSFMDETEEEENPCPFDTPNVSQSTL